MSEREPTTNTSINSMAPAVGIGGLGSIDALWPYYGPILGGGGSVLSVKESFRGLRDHGKGPLPEAYEQLEEQLTAIHERLEEPMVLVAHSLGVLLASKFTLDHPDKVLALEGLAGMQDGLDEFTLSGKALKKALGNPVHAKDLLRESPYMTDHRRRMATEWPAHVPLHLISPTYDILIPAPQGQEVELPDGQEPERLIVVPRLPIPGIPSAVRRKTAHLPNVRELRPVLAADHFNLPVCLPVISHTRQLRRDVAQGSEFVPSLERTPELIALPAAA